MQNWYKISNSVLNVLGIVYASDKLNTIIGIIILLLNVLSILYTLVYSIYKSIKNKRCDNIGCIIDYAIKDLEHLKNGESLEGQKESDQDVNKEGGDNND